MTRSGLRAGLTAITSLVAVACAVQHHAALAGAMGLAVVLVVGLPFGVALKSDTVPQVLKQLRDDRRLSPVPPELVGVAWPGLLFLRLRQEKATRLLLRGDMDQSSWRALQTALRLQRSVAVKPQLDDARNQQLDIVAVALAKRRHL